MKADISTFSYKPKETKRGYLRVNGKFAPEAWTSKNHRRFDATISEGDEIDARGNVFAGGDGKSRWDAPWPQWVKIRFEAGKLRYFNYKDEELHNLDWIQVQRYVEEEVAV